MNNEKNIPLSLMMENAKGNLNQAFAKVMQESNLPAYLMEGILTGILSEVRNQKNLELAADFASLNNQNQEQKKEKEGEE